MKIDREAGMKAILEPSPEELERVVAAALKARPRRSRASWPLLPAAGVFALLAMLAIYARRELSFTEPLPVVPGTEPTSRVSNSGAVMLVQGPTGRTLIANRAAVAHVTDGGTSYRLMISKGTAQ